MYEATFLSLQGLAAAAATTPQQLAAAEAALLSLLGSAVGQLRAAYDGDVLLQVGRMWCGCCDAITAAFLVARTAAAAASADAAATIAAGAQSAAALAVAHLPAARRCRCWATCLCRLASPPTCRAGRRSAGACCCSAQVRGAAPRASKGCASQCGQAL